jgi:hypothetical protein
VGKANVMSIQDVLANTWADDTGVLLCEGAAALLNSMTHTGFLYTIEQVRDTFAAAATRGSETRSRHLRSHLWAALRLAIELKNKSRRDEHLRAAGLPARQEERWLPVEPLQFSHGQMDAVARAPDAGVYLPSSDSMSGTGTLFSGPLSTHCITCMCPVISAKVRAMLRRVSHVAAAEAGRV